WLSNDLIIITFRVIYVLQKNKRLEKTTDERIQNHLYQRRGRRRGGRMWLHGYDGYDAVRNFLEFACGILKILRVRFIRRVD
ncbi:hypothetical protein, partial [Enterococcus faecium]|uniref:hypothetical protein n=1 Tax=Enterococcus faecium TaxID=1352 RepID=UPI002930DDED